MFSVPARTTGAASAGQQPALLEVRLPHGTLLPAAAAAAAAEAEAEAVVEAVVVVVAVAVGPS